MKKISFVFLLGLLLGAARAFAQTPAAKPAAPTAAGGMGKTIPVAEYYEGGQEAMYAFIDKQINYPVLARRNRIQGTCIVSFTLNTDGTMTGIKLVKGVGGGLGEEALRVVRLLKFNKPDYAVLTSLPIVFRLSANKPAGTTE
jgi:protein TonB